MEEEYEAALDNLKVALFDNDRILATKINEINKRIELDSTNKELLKEKEQLEIKKNNIEELGYQLVDQLREYSSIHVNVDDKVLQEAIDKVDDKTITDTFNKDDSNSKQIFAEIVNEIKDAKIPEEAREEIKRTLPIIEEGKMSKDFGVGENKVEVPDAKPVVKEAQVLDKKIPEPVATTTPAIQTVPVVKEEKVLDKKIPEPVATATPVTQTAPVVKEEKVLDKKILEPVAATTPVTQTTPVVKEEEKVVNNASNDKYLVVHRDSKKTIAAIIVTDSQEKNLCNSKDKQRNLLEANKIFYGLKEYAATSKALDNALVQAITKDNKTNVDIGHIQNDSDLEDFTVKARVLEEAGKTVEAEAYKKEIENYTNKNVSKTIQEEKQMAPVIPVAATTPTIQTTQVVQPVQKVMAPLTPTNTTNDNAIRNMVASVTAPTNTGGSYGK